MIFNKQSPRTDEIFIDNHRPSQNCTHNPIAKKRSHKELKLERSHIVLMIVGEEQNFGFSYIFNVETKHPFVTKINQESAAERSNLKINTNIILINGKPTYNLSPSSISKWIHRAFHKKVMKMVTTAADIISIDGFHLINANNDNKFSNKANFNNFKNFVRTSGRTIRDSFKQILTRTNRGSKKGLYKLKNECMDSHSNEALEIDNNFYLQTGIKYDFDFNKFLNSMIEVGRCSDNIRDQSNYENLMHLVTSPRIKDVFHICHNIGIFVQEFHQEQYHMLNPSKKMKIYLKNINKSDEYNQLVKIMQKPSIQTVYSTFYKVIEFMKVKKPIGFFRTDSQKKFESYINGKSYSSTKFPSISERMRYSASKKLTLPTSKLHNSCLNANQNKMNGINFETMQIINLTLGDNENLGITVVNDFNNSILIARVLKDGVASKSGLLTVDDEIYEVNDEPVKGLDVEEVVKIIEEQKKSGSISLLICHESYAKRQKMYENMPIDHVESEKDTCWIRAQFDYLPSQDPFIPCVKIGLPFNIGDILQIVSKDDHHYWQAQKATTNINIGCEFDNRVGLIPSKIFRVQCQSVKAALMEEEIPKKTCCTSLSCKSKLNNSSESLFGDLDIAHLSYQEVQISLPDPFKRKAIAVIASCSETGYRVILNTLMRHPDVIEIPVIHTNNAKKVERDPAFNYLDSQSYQKAILHNELVTFERYRGFNYGILSHCVSQISRAGKTCLFIASEKHVDLLIKSSFKPFIVLLVSESLNSGKDSSGGNSDKLSIENKLKRRNERLLERVKPFSDYCIRHSNVDESSTIIVQIAMKLSNEAHWTTI